VHLQQSLTSAMFGWIRAALIKPVYLLGPDPSGKVHRQRNSAELSKAINSMFLWYRNASTCLAYLCDVPGGQTEVDCAAKIPPFGLANGFTRGWTLQELLAPSQVEFVAQDWQTVIGTK